MAINYKEHYDKMMSSDLSTTELKYIADAEEYIDSEIIRQFGRPSMEVRVNYSIATFRYSPKANKGIFDLYEPRKPIMTNELKRRFEDAGWVITVDMSDGGGMNDCDYWVLKGKKK
jgi:hypothetical protein